MAVVDRPEPRPLPPRWIPSKAQEAPAPTSLPVARARDEEPAAAERRRTQAPLPATTRASSSLPVPARRREAPGDAPAQRMDLDRPPWMPTKRRSAIAGVRRAAAPEKREEPRDRAAWVPTKRRSAIAGERRGAVAPEKRQEPQERAWVPTKPPAPPPSTSLVTRPFRRRTRHAPAPAARTGRKAHGAPPPVPGLAAPLPAPRRRGIVPVLRELVRRILPWLPARTEAAPAQLEGATVGYIAYEVEAAIALETEAGIAYEREVSAFLAGD
jgi:hypothetical protein